MNDLDEESMRALARSFYVVRMARCALLVLFLTAFTVASLATGHPMWAALLAGVVIVLLAAAVATRRRYVSAMRAPTGGPLA